MYQVVGGGSVVLSCKMSCGRVGCGEAPDVVGVALVHIVFRNASYLHFASGPFAGLRCRFYGDVPPWSWVLSLSFTSDSDRPVRAVLQAMVCEICQRERRACSGKENFLGWFSLVGADLQIQTGQDGRDVARNVFPLQPSCLWESLLSWGIGQLQGGTSDSDLAHNI